MKDPFPPPPAWLVDVVQPYAEAMGLPTLPLHLHEILFFCALYTITFVVISPVLSPVLFPAYKKLSRSRQISWDVHVVSLLQSVLIDVASLYVMYADEERYNMTWEQRVWGYTGSGGFILSMACGYFLWDLVVTARHIAMFELGMLAHAVCALLVYTLGFTPYVNFYAPTFILFELSSPFLNVHWFCDKLGLTGSSIQLYNGIVLIVVFFCCRLVWGTYQAARVYTDIWKSIHFTPAAPGSLAAEALAADELMIYAGDQYVPIWLGMAYFVSNMILNCLNFFWFGKMIDTIRKRFQPPQKAPQQDIAVAKTTGTDGKVTLGVNGVEVRNRQPVTPGVDEIPPTI